MTSPSPVTQLQTQIADYKAEVGALDAALTTLLAEAWTRPTTFKQWTIWDVVAHLHSGDLMGLLTLNDPDEYVRQREANAASGLSRTAIARERFGHLDGLQLRAVWHEATMQVCEQFADADPAARLRWSGPGMKPRMFVTARQMETWAHGTEIYDLFELPREHFDRIYSIATLGVRTFAWTFNNRELAVPEVVPYVELVSPSGKIWSWNEASSHASVKGSAVEFCQVVTQVRNIDDVQLDVRGEAAQQWMEIAQCFAGLPENPPPPGARAKSAATV